MSLDDQVLVSWIVSHIESCIVRRPRRKSVHFENSVLGSRMCSLVMLTF